MVYFGDDAPLYDGSLSDARSGGGRRGDPGIPTPRPRDNTPHTCPPGEYVQNDDYGDGWKCVPANTQPTGGGGGGGGGAFSYTAPSFPGASRPVYNFGPAPEFDAPEFQAPTEADLYADPSYEFRRDQGAKVLENSAAARGVLRTGGTYKGLQEYGQQFASQEWGNVFDRALAMFDRKYRGALDEFKPRYSEWETLTGAEQRGAELGWQREWDEWVFRINDEFRREQMLFEAGASE